MMNCFIIANLTFKEIIRQSLFYVIISGGAAIILLTSCFTLFAFGEELRLLRDMGVTTITLGGIIITLFYIAGASNEEAKRVVSATILSKPVNKGGFVAGKFLGTIYAICSVNIILAVFLVSVLTLYNNLNSPGNQPYLFFKDTPLLLGVYFAGLQAMILAAISLLLSVYLAAVSNVSICLAIYLLGHLSGYFSAYFEKNGGITSGISKIIFTIIPDLQGFELGNLRPDSIHGYNLLAYLFNTSAYTLCYCVTVIAFAIWAFKKRDIL